MVQNGQPQLPIGTKRLCIFDTNAYRELTIGKSLAEATAIALRIRELELGATTRAAANPFVIWELIGHLDNPTDPAYQHCLNALVALSEHTWSLHDPPGGLCLTADAESTVCDALFQAAPLVAWRNVQNLSLLAAHVKQHAPSLTDPAAVNNIRVFAAAMRKKETEWLRDLRALLDGCDPKLAHAWIGGRSDKETRRKLRDYFGSQAFMDAWATIGVMRHAELVGMTLTQKELAKKGDVMRNVFAAPFRLTSVLLQKFPTARQINLTSRKKKWGNYMWDAAICYSIGRFHQIDGASVFLVTGDRAIRDAAVAANCAGSVVPLSDYLKALGLGLPRP
ncbi:MAG: hypothetical protein WA005_03125 [Candidatus Binataceae bacterium]